MRLASLSEPVDSADWIFLLKYDGFRAVAEIASGECRLFSRNRNVYRRFEPLAQWLGRVIRAETVLDGEIVCLDAEGRPQFYDLLRRRVDPVFVAFDILALDGEDLRHEPLIARKRVLRSILPKQGPVLYAGFVETTGGRLYESACQHDLEGVVAMWKHGRYVCGENHPPGRSLSRLVHTPHALAKYTWLKIKNPTYSQAEGRNELFEPRTGSPTDSEVALVLCKLQSCPVAGLAKPNRLLVLSAARDTSPSR